MSARRVLVYGGNGALGSVILKHFKREGWWALVIDTQDNPQADETVFVPADPGLGEQEQVVVADVKSRLSPNAKFEAIICVAGGWAGGNLQSDFAFTSELMWRQSVCSSVIASCLAAHFLKDKGFLMLTGASAALSPTPGMLGYGMVKASVHHLVKSLGGKGSGMPKESCCVGILPVTLDTVSNRANMPNSDFTKWTPLQFVADLCYKWSCNEGRPTTGSLLRLVTQNSETSVVPV
ncbi:hypothetical protein FQA39_LY07195 [Lamprigera yunnana]|nr:hypothetical protein FQA39_LY07195 [Lamprigera yunnana]